MTVLVVSPNSKGYQMVVPQTVSLTINYYQIDKGQKILVSGTVDFFDQCVTSVVAQDISNAAANGIFPCETNAVTGDILSKGYTLQIEFAALDWMSLMNQFQFSFQVYVLIFIVIGICSVAQGVSNLPALYI